MRELFSKYGSEVVDVKFKQYRIDETRQIYNGIGFVLFPLTVEGVLTVKKILHALHCVAFNENCLDTGISVTLETILKERPELNVPFIPEGMKEEPVYTSGRKTKIGIKRNNMGDTSMSFVPLQTLKHFITPPAEGPGASTPTTASQFDGATFYGQPQIAPALSQWQPPFNAGQHQQTYPGQAYQTAPSLSLPPPPSHVPPKLHINRHYNALKQQQRMVYVMHCVNKKQAEVQYDQHGNYIPSSPSDQQRQSPPAGDYNNQWGATGAQSQEQNPLDDFQQYDQPYGEDQHQRTALDSRRQFTTADQEGGFNLQQPSHSEYSRPSGSPRHHAEDQNQYYNQQQQQASHGQSAAQYEASLEAKFEQQRRELLALQNSERLRNSPPQASYNQPPQFAPQQQQYRQQHAGPHGGKSMGDMQREQEAARKLQELREKHQQAVQRTEQYEIQRLARLEENRMNIAQQQQQQQQMQRNQKPLPSRYMSSQDQGYRPSHQNAYGSSLNEGPSHWSQQREHHHRAPMTSYQNPSYQQQHQQQYQDYNFSTPQQQQQQQQPGRRMSPPSLFGNNPALRRSHEAELFDSIDGGSGRELGAGDRSSTLVDISGLSGITSGMSRASLNLESALGGSGAFNLSEPIRLGGSEHLTGAREWDSFGFSGLGGLDVSSFQ
eukprot:gene23679-29924_t